MRFRDGWELIEYVWTDELAALVDGPIELSPALVAAALWTEARR